MRMAAENPIEVEGYKEGKCRLAFRKENEFRTIGSEGGKEEEDACHNEGALASQTRSGKTREGTADDAAYESAGGSDSVKEIRICEILCLKEECLKPLFGAGNDGGVVTEEQSSDYSNKDYRKEIALAAFICI